MNDYDRITEEAWKEKNIYLYKSMNERMEKENQSYPSNKLRTEELAEQKYELSVEEITRNLSTQFLLKLSGCVVATMPEKCKYDDPMSFSKKIVQYRPNV